MPAAKRIRIADKYIGGGSPILVQSMCNTPTKDAEKTIKQIHLLEKLGCEIIRVAVPDMDSAKALKTIKKNISIPIVADIHYDYRLAVESAKYVDKLRINPGNIGDEAKIVEVVKAAKQYKLPIRIGVNLGSIEREIKAKYGLTPEAMVKSAEKHIALLEKNHFFDIVVSLKASDVTKTIIANRLFAKQFSYPLHLGITEAGSVYTGTINNAVGIGVLLAEGIGDTIRVSISGNPAEEVRAGWQILKALRLRERGITVVACPTCARTEIDVAKIAQEIEEKTAGVNKVVKVAVMGCAVNGIGEAEEADIGVVGKRDGAFLYKKGEFIEKIPKNAITKRILQELQ